MLEVMTSAFTSCLCHSWPHHSLRKWTLVHIYSMHKVIIKGMGSASETGYHVISYGSCARKGRLAVADWSVPYPFINMYTQTCTHRHAHTHTISQAFTSQSLPQSPPQRKEKIEKKNHQSVSKDVLQTDRHTHAEKCRHRHTHTCMVTYADMHTHRQTQRQTHIHTCMHTHTVTHMDTCTHT